MKRPIAILGMACATVALAVEQSPAPQAAVTDAAPIATASATTPSDARNIVKHLPKGKLDEIRYRRTGGMLVKPGTQNGRIVYVNCQEAVPQDWLVTNATVFAQETRFKVDVSKGKFAFPKPTIVGNASLFVIDDPDMPTLLAAPEDRWVAVNVAPLKAGAGEKRAFFAARVNKELTRGFCLLAGAQDSNYPNALVGCVTKAEDLDKFFDCVLPVDVPARFPNYVKGYGVTPAEITTYRMACQEGWASAPTNDVQKAIWDKVHEMPSEPLKIKPETKKTEK